MVHQQIVVERVRMIEICDLTIVERKILEIAVIGILLNKNYFAGANRFEDAICNGCLSRSRTTTNTNYHSYNSCPDNSLGSNAKVRHRKSCFLYPTTHSTHYSSQQL